jgi:acyl-CoA reductase-like NAD-dependent aldehyde dehydrogenase
MVVVKPAEQTPTSVMCLMELIGDVLPAGEHHVTGFGNEAGAALATSDRIFHLQDQLKLDVKYTITAENIIPVTMELGGKSPNVFPSVADHDDALNSKAIEGALMFA